MEPVMIVVLGVIVGGMVVAMYLPIFKLVTVVAGRSSGGPSPFLASRTGRAAPPAAARWEGLRR